MEKNTHSPIKHIWFDFAGTLYKESPDFKQAHQAFRYKIYAELLHKTDIAEAKREYDKLYEEHGSNSAVFRALGQSSDYWQKAVDSFNRTSFFAPDQEVIETLDSLRKIVPISIFTNFMLSKIHEMLSYLEIPSEFFTYILGGDDIAERKPALDGFHLMIKKSQLPAEQLIYVGDREAVDIAPAKAVGMQACILYSDLKTAADYSFDSFSDLVSLVNPQVT